MSAGGAVVRGNEDTTVKGQSLSSSELEELRRILVGPEQEAIEALRAELDDERFVVSRVEAVLPEVFARLAQAGPALQDALSPLVVRSVARALETQPTKFAGYLIPVVLPAVRRAIFAQLRAYIRSLEKTVEHALTLRTIRWRWTALRTGRPVREIALRESFLSRVEELILVHDASGLMVGHVALDRQTGKDPDLVSAMLSAVQSFVRDAFSSDASEGLERVEFGAHELWLVQGRHTTLAAAVRGFGPQELRARLEGAVDRIETALSSALDGFDGSQDVRSSAEPVLLEYLEVAERPKKRWGRIPLGLVVLLVVALGVWRFVEVSARQKAAEAWVEGLHQQPGFVVLSTSWKGEELAVEALRDPLSEAPSAPPPSVVPRWRSFASVAPPIVLERARRALRPPPTVSLSLEGPSLVATGTASAVWLRNAERTAKALPGVKTVDLSRVFDVSLARVEVALEEAERLAVRFAVGSGRPEERGALDELGAAVRGLDLLAEGAGVHITLRVLGTADPTGTDRQNRRLRAVRERLLLDRLRALPLRRVRLEGAAAGEDESEPRDRAARVRAVRVEEWRVP